MNALCRFYGWSRACLAYRRRREVDHIHHRHLVRLYTVCSIQSKIVYARNGLVEYGQSVTERVDPLQHGVLSLAGILATTGRRRLA